MSSLDAHDGFTDSIPCTARRVVRRAPLERGGVVLARGGERAARLRIHAHREVSRSLAPGGLASRADASRQGAARGEVEVTNRILLLVSRRVRVGRGVVQRPGEEPGVVFPRRRGERARVALRGRVHPSTGRWRTRAWTSGKPEPWFSRCRQSTSQKAVRSFARRVKVLFGDCSTIRWSPRDAAKRQNAVDFSRTSFLSFSRDPRSAAALRAAPKGSADNTRRSLPTLFGVSCRYPRLFARASHRPRSAPQDGAVEAKSRNA
jgi:hypothetical protein